VADIANLNYNGKLEEIKMLLKLWSRRYLTPFGKITVIKTLAISKIIHLFSNLPDPPDEFLYELNKCFFDFLWDGKVSKINKKAVIMPYENGGLKMLDVYSFLTSLKLSWFKRIINADESFTQKLLYLNCPGFKDLQKFGDDYTNVLLKTCKNRFWIDVLTHYKKACYNFQPNTCNEFLSECIHYNHRILRGNKTLHVPEWIDYNILYIGDLIKNDGSFLTHEEFIDLYPGINTNFLDFEGAIRAINDFKVKCNINIDNNNRTGISTVWQLINLKKGIYLLLTQKQNDTSCFRKWEAELNRDIDWKKVFGRATRTTRDCGLKWLQFKIVYRFFPTNRFLHIRKIKNSPLCTFCNEENETICHLLWDCPFTTSFWKNIIEQLRYKCVHCNNLEFSKELVILGCKLNTRTDKVLDLIILLAKFHIYKCKINNLIPNITHFLNSLKQRYEIEKYCCKINGNYHQFEEIWLPYKNLCS